MLKNKILKKSQLVKKKKKLGSTKYRPSQSCLKQITINYEVKSPINQILKYKIRERSINFK
jgi:hypothetical protein